MTITSFKRIHYERDAAFKAHDKRGHSKHAKKLALRESARAAGTPCSHVRGLFSSGTFETYLKQIDNFIVYVYSIGTDIKHLDGCKPFIWQRQVIVYVKSKF